MKAVAEIKPKSVLDLGIGFGKFGFLIREYFDLRPGKRGGYDRWKMKIDGIEIFREYITDVHEYIYDDIFIGNAAAILSEKNLYYDMVIGVDILEHFTKKDGYTFIEKAKGVSNNVLISTPYIYFEQDEMFGNEYEKHLSGWNFRDLNDMGFRYLWKTGISMLGVFSDSNLNLPEAGNLEDNEFDSQDLNKISNLVKMYYETYQVDECIEAAEFYLAVFDSDPLELLLILAVCYEKIGNPDKSCDYAKRVIELDQNNKTAIDICNRASKMIKTKASKLIRAQSIKLNSP